MRIARVSVRLCYSYSPPVSVWTTSKPTSARSRTKIVTRPNLSVPLNGEIVWKCRIGLFGTKAICSCMWEAVLKLTMDYKMTKHMLNNCTLKESRTWLLVSTRHCYFIPFNHEHPVGIGTCNRFRYIGMLFSGNRSIPLAPLFINKMTAWAKMSKLKNKLHLKKPCRDRFNFQNLLKKCIQP